MKTTNSNLRNYANNNDVCFNICVQCTSEDFDFWRKMVQLTIVANKKEFGTYIFLFKTIRAIT